MRQRVAAIGRRVNTLCQGVLRKQHDTKWLECGLSPSSRNLHFAVALKSLCLKGKRGGGAYPGEGP
jgi:hypothetical protein